MHAEEIKRVLVIGAGTMGEGIAQDFAQSGFTVYLTDIDDPSLGRCRHQIRANLELLKELGQLSEDPSLIMSRIEARRINDLSEIKAFEKSVDFVIEAIPEDLDLKRMLFAHLDSFPKDIILSSNTSSYPMTSLAEGLKTPDRIVGLHYLYPAHIIPLVEIHSGEKTTAETISITRELMIRVGKKPIVVRKEIPGFIVNRIQAAYNREVTYLLNEGVATAEDLDTAAKAGFGFRLACLGPLEIHDLNGLDVVLKAGGRTRQSICNDREPSPLLKEKVENGELGVKSGKGWHDYHGKTREEILDQANRKLLQQLALFRILNNKNGQ